MALTQKIEVLLLTQPSLFDDTPRWEGVEGSAYFIQNAEVVSAATWWKLLDLYNQELMSVCAEKGVACFDLASAVPHDEAYFYDAVHFTEAGAALVADRVAEAVVTRLWKVSARVVR